MNWLQRVLAQTPDSDDSFHCPWFRLIEYFALLGIVFGLIAYLVDDSIPGLVALLVGLASAFFTFGTRRRGANSC